ncbi:MAG: ribosomal protein S5 domain 2-type protein [Monoraphidium minutum]|nr:MAG: ribosomal protein S5 domain 2-type protein [Monoraphidium minutum]
MAAVAPPAAAAVSAAHAADGAGGQQQQQQQQQQDDQQQHQHQQQQKQQLQADAFKRLYPEQFFARFAAEGLRPDGRALTTARPVTIGLAAVSAADGSALVRVGSTAVLAGCRLEVAAPGDEAPGRGQLVVSAEITPLARGERPGRPPPDAHALAARVSALLGGALDTTQLCISRGAAVWVLYLDLYVLDAAGGLLDAALLAGLAALRDCRLPPVHLTPEGNVERGPDPDGGAAGGGARPLALACAPACLTCGVYKGRVVVDPDHEEEGLMGARVTAAVGGDGELLGVYKPGGAELVPPQTLLTIIALARSRQKEVCGQLEAALAAQAAAAADGV